MDLLMVHVRESTYATNSHRHQIVKSLIFVLTHCSKVNLQYLFNHLLVSKIRIILENLKTLGHAKNIQKLTHLECSLPYLQQLFICFFVSETAPVLSYILFV